MNQDKKPYQKPSYSLIQGINLPIDTVVRLYLGTYGTRKYKKEVLDLFGKSWFETDEKVLKGLEDITIGKKEISAEIASFFINGKHANGIIDYMTENVKERDYVPAVTPASLKKGVEMLVESKTKTEEIAEEIAKIFGYNKNRTDIEKEPNDININLVEYQNDRLIKPIKKEFKEKYPEIYRSLWMTIMEICPAKHFSDTFSKNRIAFSEEMNKTREINNSYMRNISIDVTYSVIINEILRPAYNILREMKEEVGAKIFNKKGYNKVKKEYDNVFEDYEKRKKERQEEIERKKEEIKEEEESCLVNRIKKMLNIKKISDGLHT